MSVTMTETLSPPLFTYRRQILGELATMNGILMHDSLRVPFRDDEMTAKICLWHSRFVQEVRWSDNLYPVVAANIRSLREILVDPIEHSRLEKISYFANGMAIGRRAFSYYLHYNTLTDDVFPAIRHTIVECAVLCLQRHDADEGPHPEITETYKRLKREGALPEIMIDPVRVRRMRQMRKIVREQEAIGQAEVRFREEGRREIVNTAVAYIGRSLLNIREVVGAAEEREAARVVVARERDVENEARLREEEARWAERNAEFRARIEVLTANVEMIWAGIPEVERDIARVTRSIEFTERAIKDKKSRDKSNAWETMIRVAVFATASWGAHLAITEAAGGGIMIGTSIPW